MLFNILHYLYTVCIFVVYLTLCSVWRLGLFPVCVTCVYVACVCVTCVYVKLALRCPGGEDGGSGTGGVLQRREPCLLPHLFRPALAGRGGGFRLSVQDADSEYPLVLGRVCLNGGSASVSALAASFSARSRYSPCGVCTRSDLSWFGVCRSLNACCLCVAWWLACVRPTALAAWADVFSALS